MSSTFVEAIAEARELARNLSQSLPSSISVASLGVSSKTPYKALTVREALIWRMEELGRVTCDLLEQENIVAAALLARAALEGTAMMWELRRLIEGRADIEAIELDRRIHALLLGQRIETDQVKIPNILGLIDKLERRIEGTRGRYETLSEYVHPNWSGVAGIYSQIDQKDFKTDFGKNSNMVRSAKMISAIVIINSLTVFTHDYNAIAETMPIWLSELQSF